MKVVLSTSPHVRHAAVLQSDFSPDRRVMYTFAPVGLLSLIGTLRRDRPDIACELYDINRQILGGVLPLDREFYEVAAADIMAARPDVVGFMTECDSYHHILQIAIALKQLAPDCTIILGGPHASAVAERTLERCDAIDAIVVGEAEVTFPLLLDQCRANADGPIAGAVLRSGSKIINGGPRMLLDSLDELAMPAFDVYSPADGEEIFIEVGRGCPFQCDFCSTAPYWGRKHRVKSPARVLEEVLTVRTLFGTSRVHFTHDLFTTNREWVRSICETLIEAGVPVRWTCSARTDTVDEMLLALMARAGCNAIYFGIESGSQRILREIRKDIPVDHSLSVLASCSLLGIMPNAGFIAGFPTEDEVSLRETLNAYERALRTGCRPVHLFAFCPFAGASMYARLTDLQCTGHFIDLPLGYECDLRNREIVMADRDLYGGYFRPKLPNVVVGEDSAIAAIDEFSPLVEADLVPALALAAACGGMYEVFSRWLSWIREHNEHRGAASYRRAYGTPAAFAAFIVHELSFVKVISPSLLALARAIETNLRVSEMTFPDAATTMASYRSLIVPAFDRATEITLGTRLERGSILATLALDYDITSALLGGSADEFEKRPVYLVWQLTGRERVRLLEVDAFVFDALEALDKGINNPADLILNRVSRDRLVDAPPDVSVVLEGLRHAVSEGLITIGDLA